MEGLPGPAAAEREGVSVAPGIRAPLHAQGKVSYMFVCAEAVVPVVLKVLLAKSTTVTTSTTGFRDQHI
jgi:hypothetical protein